MSKKILAVVLVGAVLLPLRAAARLFYFEAQAVAGYSRLEDKLVFSSHGDMEAMQKSSVGFDFLQRFASKRRDLAILAVQLRLAAPRAGGKGPEAQLYNAYLKLKTRSGGFWIGHNRPAFGLGSVLDQHGLLLQSLTMEGIGFDRDWGVGLESDSARGSAAFSLTAGSGMPLRLDGNYLVSGRLARGVLPRDNFSAGISLGFGRTLESMGVHMMDGTPRAASQAALDFTWLRDNLENRLEFALGSRGGAGFWALLWRGGLALLAEDRLKLEVQPVVQRRGGETQVKLYGGLTWLAGPDWTLRAMLIRDYKTAETRLVFQAYYYKRLGI